MKLVGNLKCRCEIRFVAVKTLSSSLALSLFLSLPLTLSFSLCLYIAFVFSWADSWRQKKWSPLKLLDKRWKFINVFRSHLVHLPGWGTLRRVTHHPLFPLRCKRFLILLAATQTFPTTKHFIVVCKRLRMLPAAEYPLLQYKRFLLQYEYIRFSPAPQTFLNALQNIFLLLNVLSCATKTFSCSQAFLFSTTKRFLQVYVSLLRYKTFSLQVNKG